MLIDRIQTERIRDWSQVSDDWLGLMWCLDQYRIADAPPEGLGRASLRYRSRIDGVYRMKGDWFSTVQMLLLGNRTGEGLRSLGRVQGLSQNHQIDLAWPDRDVAPIVCAESKVTGGPAYRDNPGRGAMNDWTNRRRELKFSATDLKLARREQREKIGHWDVWRRNALPRTFMLWAARLGPRDQPAKIVREARAIVETYLDGAGVFAFEERKDGRGYVEVQLPLTRSVESIDGVLYRMESEIEQALQSGIHRQHPATVAPVDPDSLMADEPTNV